MKSDSLLQNIDPKYMLVTIKYVPNCNMYSIITTHTFPPTSGFWQKIHIYWKRLFCVGDNLHGGIIGVLQNIFHINTHSHAAVVERKSNTNNNNNPSKQKKKSYFPRGKFSFSPWANTIKTLKGKHYLLEIKTLSMSNKIIVVMPTKLYMYYHGN